MSSKRTDSLSSTELDNLIIDELDNHFGPTIPQASSSNNTPSEPPTKKPLETPSYIKHLILAYKAFKKFGWMEPAIAFRRHAFDFSPFESRLDFGYAKRGVQLPHLEEAEEDLMATERYLKFAWKAVRNAIDDMEGDNMVGRAALVENSLEKFQRKAKAGGGFVGGL